MDKTQTSLPWGNQELLEEVGKVLASGGGGARRESPCSCIFLYPISIRYQGWIEWNACVVPVPVRTVRYRMIGKNDNSLPPQGIILRNLNMSSKLLVC